MLLEMMWVDNEGSGQHPQITQIMQIGKAAKKKTKKVSPPFAVVAAIETTAS